MTFNVWYGGVQVDFHSIGRAIRAADADIVGVQEPEGGCGGSPARRACPYVDPTLHVISRYPLFAATSAACGSRYAATDLDHVVAIANVHLTATPYGPEAVRDGELGRGRAEARARDAPARDQALPAAAGARSRGAACRSSSPAT